MVHRNEIYFTPKANFKKINIVYLSYDILQLEIEKEKKSQSPCNIKEKSINSVSKGNIFNPTHDNFIGFFS